MLPHPDDPPSVWRRFAVTVAPDPAARAALLDALAAQPEATLEAVLPALATRARGRARAEVLEAIAALAPRRPLAPGTVYVLTGELLGSSGATRGPCVRALRTTAPEVQRAVALALSLAVRVPAARGGGERARDGLAVWVQAGGDDPLRGADPAARWRAWLDGGDDEPALDHALLLATAGAPRGAVDQLRAVAAHVIERRGAAGAGAAALLAWLARECTGADDLPASVCHAAWLPVAARALALTALHAAGPAAALSHVAGTLTEGPLERALAAAVLRACVLDARRGPGEAASALGEAVGALTEALAAVQVSDPAWRVIVGLLLGRDRDGALLGAGRWLTEDLRARVHAVALTNPVLGARRLSLADLEAQGVPAAVVPLLREIARTDPDPITRQHAKQLARGERL